MKTCPTCNADLKGASVCRRCKTDFAKALQASNRAEYHFKAAHKAQAEGRFGDMLIHAQRSFALRRTPQNARLLACAALVQKDYPLALSVWAVAVRKTPHGTKKS
jgi:predicted amidophosphoribosyltransferase